MFIALNKAVTLLGSAPVVLPVSGVLAAVLWRRHSVKAAAGWVAALALMVAVVMLLKIAGHACNVHFLDDRLTSPSGHAALSAAVYGAVGVVVARHVEGWRRNAFLLAVFGVVAGVAVSRVILRSHSVTEVTVGLALGGLAVAAFAQGLARIARAQAAEVTVGQAPPPLSPSPWRWPSSPLVVAPLLAVAVLLLGAGAVTFGNRTTAEPMLKHIAMLLRQDDVLCGPVSPLDSLLPR
ncbi:phosphatase PAP2 family protein [Azospirillum rugosum]|uniref:Membrane-associated phospholipid phosphatase n=1 Tax=Azospirillum rugosum TaxID=416170 RepID=A0ABS4SHJ1_9PROT|nr:phosphatase PAP2 family protein [Azospirillum rugosum]MBP2292029.1 membrane-associated phospholipid phosphatase [Azospirillum rugosum]MDQ0525835.1 membrane-associated phospholipid phosphatase [Azospirillum rugosum]